MIEIEMDVMYNMVTKCLGNMFSRREL